MECVVYIIITYTKNNFFSPLQWVVVSMSEGTKAAAKWPKGSLTRQSIVVSRHHTTRINNVTHHQYKHVDVNYDTSVNYDNSVVSTLHNGQKL